MHNNLLKPKATRFGVILSAAKDLYVMQTKLQRFSAGAQNSKKLSILNEIPTGLGFT